MIACPKCGSTAKHEVTRTFPEMFVGLLTRVRRCAACGHCGYSVEHWPKEGAGILPAPYPHATGTLPAPILLPAPYGHPAGTLPAPAGTPNGGVGGDLSSGSDPISSSDLSASGSGARARVAKRGPRRAEEYGADFLMFWEAYPNKKGKGKAWEAWQARKPNIHIVLTALAWQVEQPDWTKEGGKFIPHPATWINGTRWEDEPVTPLRPAMPERTTRMVGAIQDWLDSKKGGNG